MHLQQLLLPVVYLATFARAGSVCLSVMDHPKDGQVDSNYEFTAFPPGHACDSGYLMSGGGSVLSNVVTQANFCDSLPIDIEVCGTKATLVKIDDAAPLNGMPKNQRCGVRLQIGNTIYGGRRLPELKPAGQEMCNNPKPQCPTKGDGYYIVGGKVIFENVPMCDNV